MNGHVGYRRPPRHSRFKKGQSRKPSCRPRGRKPVRRTGRILHRYQPHAGCKFVPWIVEAALARLTGAVVGQRSNRGFANHSNASQGEDAQKPAKCVAVRVSLSNHFNHDRSLSQPQQFRMNRTAVLYEWHQPAAA